MSEGAPGAEGVVVRMEGNFGKFIMYIGQLLAMKTTTEAETYFGL